MLPRKHRLTTPTNFAKTTKSGVRVGNGNFFLYLLHHESSEYPRAGLIISKVVGGSVVRHRVSRAIRHALALEMSKLRPGTLVVVRALANARTADAMVEIPALLKKAESKNLTAAR